MHRVMGLSESTLTAMLRASGILRPSCSRTFASNAQRTDGAERNKSWSKERNGQWTKGRRVKGRASRMQAEVECLGGSRSAKVAELHRRLQEYERAETEGKGGVDEKGSWRVESEAAERMMSSDRSKYADVFAKRETEAEEREERKRQQKEEMTRHSNAFPFRADEQLVQRSGNEEEALDERKREVERGEKGKEEGEGGEGLVALSDRGFFVSGDLYVDEYTAATVLDLPEDEMTGAAREVYGAEDAIEAIDFQLPGQSLAEAHEHAMSLEEADEEEYGEYSAMEGGRSERKCAGCGANFHSMDDSLPGYLPPTLFEREERRGRRAAGSGSLCKRCHLVKNHHFLPNVNVCPVDYATMLSKLRGRQEVLILLVVDVVDLPGSIHRALPDIIGRSKPMVVVANKVDLLPPDARCGYLKRFKLAVEQALADAGFRDAFNILHTALVSAKTGYGIEDLITELHMKWTNVKQSMRDDIYLVGCTNAGKSTLFNTLLASDLCKVRAVDLVERATTSVWPGTTLSLLKFPVMRPSPFKMELRRRRLTTHRAWAQKEAYARKLALQRTGDANLAVLVEPVLNTYKEREEELQPRAVASLLEASRVDQREGEGEGEDRGTPVVVGEARKGRPWSLDDDVFAKGVWCYDTPGTVNHEQLLDVLSLRELVNVVPSRLLRPRTAIVSPGVSVLIGGLARLDILSAQRTRPIWVTVFANDALPVNVMDTVCVEEFLERNRGREALGAPIGDATRLAQLPAMEKRQFRMRVHEEERERDLPESERTLKGSADVVFSSIGWTMLSTHAGEVEVAGWLPGARGLVLRQPPILPYAASLRGPRIPGTAFYKVKAPEFPVNERRMKAERNSRRFKGNGKRND